jgi:hypothetical protein
MNYRKGKQDQQLPPKLLPSPAFEAGGRKAKRQNRMQKKITGSYSLKVV